MANKPMLLAHPPVRHNRDTRTLTAELEVRLSRCTQNGVSFRPTIAPNSPRESRSRTRRRNVKTSKMTCHSRHTVANRATFGGPRSSYSLPETGNHTKLGIFWRPSTGSEAHEVALFIEHSFVGAMEPRTAPMERNLDRESVPLYRLPGSMWLAVQRAWTSRERRLPVRF